MTTFPSAPADATRRPWPRKETFSTPIVCWVCPGSSTAPTSSPVPDTKRFCRSPRDAVATIVPSSAIEAPDHLARDSEDCQPCHRRCFTLLPTTVHVAQGQDLIPPHVHAADAKLEGVRHDPQGASRLDVPASETPVVPSAQHNQPSGVFSKGDVVHAPGIRLRFGHRRLPRSPYPNCQGTALALAAER
eukprot:scaffold1474_cov256-Pinguiococcus_pyrenoidosus.AAC.15